MTVPIGPSDGGLPNPDIDHRVPIPASEGQPLNSATLVEQIGHALDRTTSSLRAQIEASLQSLFQELATVADAEQSKAVSLAIEEAFASSLKLEEQVAQVREVAEQQLNESRLAIEAREVEARALQHELDEARRQSLDEIERVRSASHAELTAAQQSAAAEIQEARQQLLIANEELERVRRQLIDATEQIVDVQRTATTQVEEARVQTLAATTELVETAHAWALEHDALQTMSDDRIGEAFRQAQAAEEIIIDRLADAQAAADHAVNAARETTRMDACQAELARTERVLGAVRSFDDARSLSDVLDRLVDCAGREVDRVAVFVVKTEDLHGWRQSGFSMNTASMRDVTCELAAAGILGVAVRTAAPVAGLLADEVGGPDGASLPPFAYGAGARQVLAFPLLVGGRVVAVLYADSARPDPLSAASRWPAVLELFGRHASRSLELLTVQRAAGLTASPPIAAGSRGPLPGPVERSLDDDVDSARRYARLLLSEIRMYYEPMIAAGSQAADVRIQIERARDFYEARVPSVVAGRSDFFDQELALTLLDGERPLVG